MVNRMVRCDERGIFILSEGFRFRPKDVKGDKDVKDVVGDVSGSGENSHAHDMSDGGLVVGDRVKVYYRAGGSLSVKTSDGKKLLWCCED